MASANVAGLNTNHRRLQIPGNWMHLRIQNAVCIAIFLACLCMFHTFQWRKLLFPEVWKKSLRSKELAEAHKHIPIVQPSRTHSWPRYMKPRNQVVGTEVSHLGNPKNPLPCYCETSTFPWFVVFYHVTMLLRKREQTKKSGQGTVSVWRSFVLIVLKSAKAIVQFSTIRQAFIAELYVIVSSARSPKTQLWVQTHVERKDTKTEVLTPFQMYNYYWCTMMQQSFCTTWDFLQAWYAIYVIAIVNGREATPAPLWTHLKIRFWHHVLLEFNLSKQKHHHLPSWGFATSAGACIVGNQPCTHPS